DLDGRQSGDLQRVADRERVVRPRAGVEEQAVHGVFETMQLLDELALVVGLEELDGEVQLRTPVGDLGLELHQRQRPVVTGRTAAELVEVHAVHDGDAVSRVHAALSSRTAARSSPSSIWQPGRAAPGASSSTNGTDSPLR